MSKILLLSMERPLNLQGLVSFRFLLSSVVVTGKETFTPPPHSLSRTKDYERSWVSSYKCRCPAGCWEVGTDREFHGSVTEIKPKQST